MQKEQQELANLIKGKKVAFIGAGVSHKTLIREFVELGAHVTLCDQKKSVEDFGDYAATIKELGIDLSLGENYLDGFKGQDIIMRTPGFVGYFEKPLRDAMAAGTMVTSEVELFFQFCPCEIVAVTGSDGKTTTTTLISKFYEAAGRRVHLGGNIGAALLPMLPEVSPDDVAVVELSSFQLISMHQSPNIAVVTNVTPNHLDHHKDMQEYIDAKRNILLYQKQPCRAVLGYENEISRSMQKDCKGKQVWFTRLHETDNGAFLREDGMLCMAENGVVTPFLAQKDVKLRACTTLRTCWPLPPPSGARCLWKPSSWWAVISPAWSTASSRCACWTASLIIMTPSAPAPPALSPVCAASTRRSSSSQAATTSTSPTSRWPLRSRLMSRTSC